MALLLRLEQLQVAFGAHETAQQMVLALVQKQVVDTGLEQGGMKIGAGGARDSNNIQAVAAEAAKRVHVGNRNSVSAIKKANRRRAKLFDSQGRRESQRRNGGWRRQASRGMPGYRGGWRRV
ncbi:MAG: hypothetical protein ACRCSX_17660 [Allorhizobium sp.]